MKFINQKNFLQIKYWIYVISILLIIRTLLSNESFFHDFAVYINGAREFIEGGNPYGVGLPVFPFTYPPIVLIFFASINEFLAPFLLFIYLLSILLFCLFFRKEPKIFIYAILISIALLEIRRQSITYAILTGNIGFYLHLLIISLWILRNNFNTKIALYSAIAIGAIVKHPIFSIYILLPLLTDARISVSRILPGLITMIVAILIIALQIVMFPDLFSDFVSGVESHEFSDEIIEMAGWSIISLWFYVSNSHVVAIFGHIIISLLIIAFWVYYKRRYLDKIENTNFTEPCISIIPVVICMIIMPRLQLYDYTIMNFLLIYLLLKIKVFEISYNFIFKSKISLLGIIVIFIWAIQLILYFVRLNDPNEFFFLATFFPISTIIGACFPTFLVIIIALVDRSTKIRLGTWPK